MCNNDFFHSRNVGVVGFKLWYAFDCYKKDKNVICESFTPGWKVIICFHRGKETFLSCDDFFSVSSFQIWNEKGIKEEKCCEQYFFPCPYACCRNLNFFRHPPNWSQIPPQHCVSGECNWQSHQLGDHESLSNSDLSHLTSIGEVVVLPRPLNAETRRVARGWGVVQLILKLDHFMRVTSLVKEKI